jgi:hypothetical protein
MTGADADREAVGLMQTPGETTYDRAHHRSFLARQPCADR